MDLAKNIQHGVFLKFGPLPQKLTWDIAFVSWRHWLNTISWQDHLAAQAEAQARAQLRRASCFMKCRKRKRK